MSPVLTPRRPRPATGRLPLENAAAEGLPRDAEATLRDLAFILLLAERVREEIASGKSAIGRP